MMYQSGMQRYKDTTIVIREISEGNAHLGSQGLGVQIQRGVLGHVVELVIQHADDFGRLVIDDFLLLLVIEDGDGVVASVLFVRLLVDLFDEVEAIVGVRILLRKGPAIRA